MSICYIKVNHHGKALKIDRIKKQGNIDGPCIIFKSRENTGGSYLMWENRENTGGPVNMSKSSNPSLRSRAWASLTFDRCLSNFSKSIFLWLACINIISCIFHLFHDHVPRRFYAVAGAAQNDFCLVRLRIRCVWRQGSLLVPKMEFFVKLIFEVWVFCKYAELSFL